jgi:hypothetical protein
VEHRQERILAEGVEIATANKDVGHINRMLRQIEQSHRLGVGPVFAELRLEGETQGQRVAFAPEWVQTRILAEGALDALNEEARRILYVIRRLGAAGGAGAAGGLPPYRDKAASLSAAAANKALRAAGLLPPAGQSACSFRHCFEDRLTAVETPEKLIAMLMGHKYQRPRYGVGPSLAQKLEGFSGSRSPHR